VSRIVRPEVVRTYIDGIAGRGRLVDAIWQLLTLEIWMQLFLDGGSRAFAQPADRLFSS